MLEQTEGFRLSSQQRRLWLLRQGGPAYNVLCALRLEGALSAARLEAAARRIVARHEILRTTFRRLPGVKTPLQMVAADAAPQWIELTLSGADPQQLAAELEVVCEQERQTEFALEDGPLVRFSLITLAPQTHALLICAPALCADARTLRNMAEEICRLYASEQDADASDEPGQYADFAEWQSQLIGDERAAKGRAFWASKDLLSLATLKVPYAEQMQVKQTFEPHVVRVEIASTLAAGLAAHARAYASSPANFLLSVWSVLLWRLTAHCDVTVGVAFDGRKFEELGATLGPFTRHLPVGCFLRSDYTFREVLEQLDETTRQADEWQDYFTWEEVEGETAAAHAFPPISFEYAEWPREFQAGSVNCSLTRLYACSDRFKLKLACVGAGDALTVELQYDPQVFPEGVADLAAHFVALLESVVGDPEARIGELEIISPRERGRLLLDFNDTDEGDLPRACVHQLFEAQAARTPDAPAVAFEDQQLTFAALNARANHLAHYLQALGVGPEVTVGICVERSVEMIVGLLGVLKAGGAYVPLDPSHPRERIAMMLEDARATVLLTETKLLDGLPQHTAKVVCLDRESFVNSPAGNPTSGVRPENLAYVLFTSGSTGRPKGVAVEHRQLCNYLTSVSRRLDLAAGQNYAVVSTFAADLGNTVIFPALCGGGCLHVVAQERATDPDAFADYAARVRIDCLKIVPSHLESLLTAVNQEQTIPRQRLILGGETSRWDFIRLVQRLAPGCTVFNHYGPTETTVGATTYRVGASDVAQRAATVPLGRPIANTRIYLLDPDRRLLPAGLTGELCIAGSGLARGYIARPAWTAERFIPDPFSATPGARLYPTGDLARYLPDGNLEFLGRADSQIKFHGHRVELNELRHALRRHPQIRDGVVVVARDGSGSNAIVAYYVAKQELDVTGLRAFLAETIIRETMPNYFVHLKRLPLTLNGKINYRALPTLEEAKRQSSRAFLAPRTSTEEKIAAGWAQFLGVERVSLDDNFFELGGHSLLATRIVSWLRRELQVEVPLQSLFEAPTVAGLAEIIDERRARQEAAAQPCVVAPSRHYLSMAEQLRELNSLSDEEARSLLAAELSLARHGD